MREESPARTARRQRLVAARARRSNRRLAANDHLDREGEVRSEPSACILHRASLRIADRGYLPPRRWRLGEDVHDNAAQISDIDTEGAPCGLPVANGQLWKIFHNCPPTMGGPIRAVRR